MTPRSVGRFRIERTLGVGMFSKVLLGVDDGTGERYALKVMRKDTLESLDMSKYARREAHVLRRLAHPRIVPLVEAVQSDRMLFLVMPVAPGAELLSLVSDGPLEEDAARGYVAQLVDAVGYMHRNGVAHRDLKPENVIVDAESRTLMLIDFGLTGLIRPDTRMMTVCGTDFYSAPEVTYGGGAGYSGAAADAWSVGVLAYILLTGAHPFVSTDGELMVSALCAGELRIPASLSAGAAQLLRGLLARAPDTRCSMATAALLPWLAAAPPPPPLPPPDAARTEPVPDVAVSPRRHARASFRYDSSSRLLSFSSPVSRAKKAAPAKAQSQALPPPLQLAVVSPDESGGAPSQPGGPVPASAARRFTPSRPGTFSGAVPQRQVHDFSRVETDRLAMEAKDGDPAAGGSSSFFRFRRLSAAAAGNGGGGGGGGGGEEVVKGRVGYGRERRSIDNMSRPLYPDGKRSWHGVLSTWRTRRVPPASGKT